MRVLLVGGGKVGSFLARELVSEGHFVAVVETNEERARAAADDIDAVVIHGDGTDVGVLRSADVAQTDWLLAVTGLDEVNLVACQLGLTLGAERVMARLNAPDNRATFEALEIPVVAVTDLIVHVISQEIAATDLSRIAVVGRGQISLCEFEVPTGFPPTEVRELDLPAPAVLAAVVRGDHVLVPEADTVVEPGDRITAVTTVVHESDLVDLFIRGGTG
jgi:trk system potassium uptake protein TrkA